jgi:hypothetical protein
MMKQTLTFFFVLMFFNTQAVVYDSIEINRELNQHELHTKTQEYLTKYFTAKRPDKVVDELVNADLIPLHKEYILYQLLSTIAQQPPQDYHQYVVDLLKTYQVQATRDADEGPLPVAIFNLSSKAYGIENIWLAYRTEQRFNQLFNKSIPQAVTAIDVALSAQSRPQWLGIKNSISALSDEQISQLNDYLSTKVKINSGLDQLISHMGLETNNISLIKKALNSDLKSIREYTLRKSIQHFPKETAKELLLDAAQNSPDQKFSISLLHHFSDDRKVNEYLIDQLHDKQVADSAAYALSQSADFNLPQRLLKRFYQSSNETEKNHILLALKLNKNQAAQLAIEDIKVKLDNDDKQSQWLKSFDGAVQ